MPQALTIFTVGLPISIQDIEVTIREPVLTSQCRHMSSPFEDKILTVFDRIAPLSKHGEPVRALACTYVFGAALVLIGEVNAVAPLLTMCFLVAYTFMNFSCFVLTYVRSPGFRPAGRDISKLGSLKQYSAPDLLMFLLLFKALNSSSKEQIEFAHVPCNTALEKNAALENVNAVTGMSRRRWRFWYMCTGLLGSCVCLSIMIIVSQLWAIVVLLSSFSLYLYINWRLEQAEWGSALDGIRYQLALNSLIQLEESGHHAVNWRPQVLVLYRIHLSEELKGIKHRDILRFYSYLRKGNGFAVVACVLESDSRDEHAMHKASIEKDVIKSIMKEENIRGFAECVVAPSWSEGVNYIIQLSGIGGLAPNTILVNWPAKWKTHSKKATEFLNVVTTALASEKSVLAVKGLQDMPIDKVVGTIDVWWMIHDGGFMILLSWLLVQHRMWRNCQIRIFTITEGVSEERAKNAAKLLAETLRNRRLFDVDVEVVIVDDEMIQPYTYDWSLRLDQRHKFVQQLHGAQAVNADAIPLEIDDLFKMEEEKASNGSTSPRDWTGKAVVSAKEGAAGQVAVCDLRKGSDDLADHVSGLRKASDDLTDHITGQKMEAGRHTSRRVVYRTHVFNVCILRH